MSIPFEPIPADGRIHYAEGSAAPIELTHFPECGGVPEPVFATSDAAQVTCFDCFKHTAARRAAKARIKG